MQLDQNIDPPAEGTGGKIVSRTSIYILSILLTLESAIYLMVYLYTFSKGSKGEDLGAFGSLLLALIVFVATILGLIKIILAALNIFRRKYVWASFVSLLIFLLNPLIFRTVSDSLIPFNGVNLFPNPLLAILTGCLLILYFYLVKQQAVFSKKLGNNPRLQ